MTEPEKLMYAAAFTLAYKDHYDSGRPHEVCAAYAVKAGAIVVEALRVVPDLLAINRKKWEAEVAQVAKEFDEHGRVITGARHTSPPSEDYVAMFDEFMR